MKVPTLSRPRIVLVSEGDGNGVRFTVKRDEVIVDSIYVRFGRSKRNQPGGAAFVEAALRQARVAERLRGRHAKAARK